jgi:hypothetical protein
MKTSIFYNNNLDILNNINIIFDRLEFLRTQFPSYLQTAQIYINKINFRVSPIFVKWA